MRASCVATYLVLAAACLHSNVAHATSQNVRLLTDADFDQQTREGAWLIEFFAPWCSHCKDLEPTWDALADELQGRVYVAKVDGTREKALLSRFNVNGFPMIFHVQGAETRPFNGKRTLHKLKEFALTGWQHSPKLPSWKSPTSSIGRAFGRIQGLPLRLQGYYQYLHVDKKYSQLTLLGSLLAVPLTIGLSMICVLDAYMTRRPHAQRYRTE